ncbi:NUCLEAR FUSION DEFECTIVE 4 [Spatholobus suberectus]|nr:NUCLEAR FUSION DEFECTIVE 4 [Spatholobus suberectus]
MAGGGVVYVFGSYSEAIKSSQGYDQSTLNFLGFCKDLGGNLGAPVGLLGEVTPPWLNFVNTGVINTCVKNFPESRGTILGLLKGYVGLSGAIMTQLYLAIYGNDSESLILLIAWLPAAIPAAFACVIRIMKVGTWQPNEPKIIKQFLFASIALLVLFIMVMIIAHKQIIAFSKVAYIGSATVVCGLLILPLFFAIRKEFLRWNIKEKLAHTANEVIVEKPQIVEPKESPPSPNSSRNDPNTSCFANIFNKPERGEDHTILQALISVDMLLLISSFAGYGTNVTVVDNLGQIGKSLGYTGNTVRSFVSLVSIGNYFGRVLAGFVSEILLQRYKVPRSRSSETMQ